MVNFASSGIPIGINIPNYDDVRQNDGFKNVDLGNAYGEMKKEKVQFIPENRIDELVKYHEVSLFVIVALHELLGHGSGKLFYNKNGTLNYDSNLLDPITNKPVTCYKDT